MANDPDRPGQGPDIGEAKQRIEREAASARQTAQHLGEDIQRQAKDVAGDVASDLQAQAQQAISEQKEMAKSGLMDVVSAIRNAADDLEQHEQPQIAGIARGLAGGIEDFSQAIGRRNLQDMVSDVQRFARDHPTAFFGGALLLGLAVTRFAKELEPAAKPGPRRDTAHGSGRDEPQAAAPHAGEHGRPAEPARNEWEQEWDQGRGRRHRHHEVTAMAEVRHTEVHATEPAARAAPSLADLVSHLGRDVSQLMSKEAGLLRAEVDEKFSNLQTAGGSLAAAGICLLAALLILLQALIVALTNLGLGAGWSSLIVGLIVGAIGIYLLAHGRSLLSTGIVPQRTQAQVQRDAQMLKEQVK